MSLTGVSRSSTPGDLTPVIAAISAGLAQQERPPDLLAIFERELQRSLSIRSVRVREIPARYRARLVTPTRTADSIVLGVPTADPRVQAVLEASTGPERILLAYAGGDAGLFSMVFGGWVSGEIGSTPVTRSIDPWI